MDADELRIGGRQRLVVEAHLGRQIAAQVVDQRIRRRDQFRQRGLALGRAQVDRDALLVDVEGLVIFAVVLAEEIRPGLARGIAVDRGILDLDNLGAEIGEQHRAVRRGTELLDGYDAHALERLHVAGFLLMNVLEMMMRCISLVPSPMQVSGASRYSRSMSNSLE